ncbi:unnamed protein product [Ambrosiozyma monospora]|uniref:Unnamed protein product n=1 Tax=Ambrosiozyma monospora TaxID=43982 RepID=A0ACB5T5D2_AMBMO|nr:unnamed protein product [Ambrosiozyma monospora]
MASSSSRRSSSRSIPIIEHHQHGPQRRHMSDTSRRASMIKLASSPSPAMNITNATPPNASGMQHYLKRHGSSSSSVIQDDPSATGTPNNNTPTFHRGRSFVASATGGRFQNSPSSNIFDPSNPLLAANNNNNICPQTQNIPFNHLVEISSETYMRFLKKCQLLQEVVRSR